MEKFIYFITHLSEPEVIAANIKYLTVIIFLNSFLEVIFPPVPGDAVLILGGSLSGYAGINPIWVIAGAFTGTFSASLLLYQAGLRMERRLLQSRRFSALLDTRTFLKLEKVLNRYGFLIILFSRFIPVVRSGIILAAGIVNLDPKKTLISLAASILASTLMFTLGGRFLGKKLEANLAFWYSCLGAILIGLAVTWVVYFVVINIVRYFQSKKK